MANQENIDRADRFFSGTDLGDELFLSDNQRYNEFVNVMADFLEDPDRLEHPTDYVAEKNWKTFYLRHRTAILLIMGFLIGLIF
ncbi:hypothetical protein J0X14_14345 [Muricauda sp. CAU 1633]|uniref:hypothetical protein n=1 Tax=Allomuricauda sp. CAU 1633 TaxID=2816036 RepID=UPI001A8FB9F6|nr:hypothetical protein [Muricauda sp. CAU 1633]MBO0323485.1 hypothetical protein [Muricauda sp. CAU 1633]